MSKYSTRQRNKTLTPPLAHSDDVQALLARLAERRPRKIDLGLDRVIRALARVGNPQDHLPA
ncbi:MAG: hypothetical protein V3V30_06150, partial [Parvularculaceae bacterium]